MKTLQQFLAVSTFALGAVLVTGCSAFDSKPDANAHAQHHPAGASDSTSMTGPGADTPTQSQCRMEKMAHMDEHMKVMREVHEKMAAAKTPEERAALKAECKKRMHEGMTMMKNMGGMMGMKGGGMMKDGGMMGGQGGMQCSMEDRQQMMEKRMQMMQSMMEMMMENIDTDAAK